MCGCIRFNHANIISNNAITVYFELDELLLDELAEVVELLF